MWKPLLLAATVFAVSVSGAYAESLDRSMDRSNPTLLNSATSFQGTSVKDEKTYYYATNNLAPGNWKFAGAIKVDRHTPVKFVGMYITCYQLDGTPLSSALHVQGKAHDYQEMTVNIPSAQPVLIEVKVSGEGEYKVKYWPKVD